MKIFDINSFRKSLKNFFKELKNASHYPIFKELLAYLADKKASDIFTYSY